MTVTRFSLFQAGAEARLAVATVLAARVGTADLLPGPMPNGLSVPVGARAIGAMGALFLGVLALTASVLAWWSLDRLVSRSARRPT